MDDSNSFAIYFNYGGYMVNIDGFLDFFGDNIHLVTGLDLDRFGFFDLVEEIDKLGCKEWNKILYKAKRGRPRIHALPSGSENVLVVPPTQGSGHIASPPTQDYSHLTAPPTQETGRKRKNPTQENEIHIAQTMKDRALMSSDKRVRLVNPVGGPSTRSRSKNSVGGPNTRSRSKNSVGGPSTKSPSKNSVGSPSTRSRSKKIQDCSISGTQESVANKLST
ncbi:mechanosensitive channel of smallconductance-like 10 [Striga asiatica]|uniref:Mechanosensitive channel of smallconductance-like 10 n=1 Tax=Striga asiatica TaxID=4170 RepID=A0A5A7QSC9_STRAF|nr:mechanosensitive channel of smallconductance-like 10 [Striga asiatica]